MKNMFFAIACLCMTACHKDAVPQKTELSYKLIWKEALTLDNSICASHSPIIFDDRVVFHKMFVGPNDVLMCKKKIDGSKIWNWDDPTDIYDGEKISSFAQKGNNLFVCSQNELYSLDVLQGKTVWKTDANLSNQYGNPRFSLQNDRIYHERHSTGEGTFLNAHDTETGHFQSIFEKQLSNNQNYESSYESYAIYQKDDGDTLLLFQNRQINFQTFKDRVDLNALNLRTHQIEWKRDSIDPGGISTVRPLYVDGNKVYFLGQKDMWCLDPRDGKTIWQKAFNLANPNINTETLALAQLQIVDGKLILKPDDGHLYALNPDTGAEYWSLNNTGSGPEGSAVYKDLFLFTSFGNGGIYAHRASDGKLMGRLQSPNKSDSMYSGAQIVTGIAVDEKEGLLFCTDGYFGMCFKIEY